MGQWLGREGYGHGDGLLEQRGGWRSDEVKENRRKGTEKLCVIVILKNKSYSGFTHTGYCDR